jgi:glycosyltransferase involved in cell wall biosynthesis
MTRGRIVGIVLVQNDDVFVERAVRNVADFCDELILVDHESTDRTTEILARLADELPRAAAHSVADPRESHDLIAPLAGQPVWAFGVDGDEIYDPRGLPEMRERLLDGEFDGWFSLKGNVLHCDRLNLEAEVAHGWLAPPARSITKLFNFAALDSWGGEAPERLHGGTPVFRDSYHSESICMLRDSYEWHESPFRCLHTCFLPRSSAQPNDIARLNPPDRLKQGTTSRVAKWVMTLAGRPPKSSWKLSRYRQGPHVRVDAHGFFPG